MVDSCSWVWILKSWKKWRKMPAWVMVAWDVLLLVSLIQWQLLVLPLMDMVFVMNTASLLKESETENKSKNPMIGSDMEVHGRKVAQSTLFQSNFMDVLKGTAAIIPPRGVGSTAR